MTRSAVVGGGEQEEKRGLHRYTAKRVTDSHKISFRKVHGCPMSRTAEQKLHRAFGK